PLSGRALGREDERRRQPGLRDHRLAAARHPDPAVRGGGELILRGGEDDLRRARRAEGAAKRPEDGQDGGGGEASPVTARVGPRLLGTPGAGAPAGRLAVAAGRDDAVQQGPPDPPQDGEHALVTAEVAAAILARDRVSAGIDADEQVEAL